MHCLGPEVRSVEFRGTIRAALHIRTKTFDARRQLLRWLVKDPNFEDPHRVQFAQADGSFEGYNPAMEAGTQMKYDDTIAEVSDKDE